MTRSLRLVSRFLSIPVLSAVLLIASAPLALAEDFNLPGLSDTVTVYEDQYGVPTIKGSSELDVAYVQGYIHARDRFFQMDFFRKVAQGRGSELVGEAALPNDLQLRTLGLGRAALATWQELDGEIKGILQAYANGVNAWRNNNPLPPEYVGLEITQVEPWTPYDSLCYYKLLAWDLSFDLDEIPNTIDLGAYQMAGDVLGFSGFDLMNDVAPLLPPDGRVTIPGYIDSIGGIGQLPAKAGAGESGIERDDAQAGARVSDTTLELARIVEEKFSQSPLLKSFLDGREKDKGSNEWAISGEFTESGYPMVANDPHLSLNTPATFHESNLVYDLGDDAYSVSGVQFPGAAGVIQGCNDHICWGSTVHPMDVNDVFQDPLQSNALGLPTHTVHNGVPEPLNVQFQSFFVNVIGDGVPDNRVRANVPLDGGGITFISPRRNNGPILGFFDGDALISQYTGWGPTFESKFVYEMNKARDMDEFKAALQYFDIGSQNWIYGDVEGNIAYFTSAENPIRSDLAMGTIEGLPPHFIRDGSGALNNEWLPVMN
ncbi:MAG: penicillin acylase family protein, partial [Gammaproteobacteria bacterium]|nr:penicillin acylase family protein [Gammaproteobacteria bacterium]